MRIKSIRAFRQNLALTKPYVIAYQTISSVENVFLEIELENGLIGRGAANPDSEVVGESPDDTLKHLQSEFIAGLVGRDIRLFNHILDEAEAVFIDRPGTLTALDGALHDAFGQFLGIPVVQFYGQKIRALPTSVTIGIMNVAETLQEAQTYMEQGFRVIKVKTGLDVAEDSERVIKLHEQFGNRLRVRVDANQGYTMDDLREFLHLTRQTNLELIEQPLPVGQEHDLRQLPQDVRQQLVADESLTNSRMALKLVQSPKPFGMFNIKLMKCGGIRSALQLAAIARHGDVRLFWGCNDESRVSIAAALHAAFACANTHYLDLDGSFDLAEDIVTGGFTLTDGYMQPTDKPGLGLLAR